MPSRPLAMMMVQLCVFVVCGDLAAQLTITTPESNHSIRQVSSIGDSNLEGIVAARRDASLPTQIRVKVQYLMLDSATRASIYANLNQDKISRATFISQEHAKPIVSAKASVSSSHQLISISRVTSYVLSASENESVIAVTEASQTSDVVRAPSVVLLSGKDVEINDLVQRPFVIDIDREGDVIEPKVQVFDEGTRLHLLATSTGLAGQISFEMSCHVMISRILDVSTDQVFGLGDEPMEVHVPLHRVTAANVAASLTSGQTLLIDPHVNRTKRVERETGVPVLSKIPYVGRSFKNTSVGTTDQHMMVLLQPSVEQGALPAESR